MFALLNSQSKTGQTRLHTAPALTPSACLPSNPKLVVASILSLSSANRTIVPILTVMHHIFILCIIDPVLCICCPLHC